MLFLRGAKFIAILALLFGLLSLLQGFNIVGEWLLPYDQALKRYGGSATSSGEIIDRGLYYVLFAFTIGSLAEIGLSLARMERGKSQVIHL
jgi:multisubunit Na+/H+ antiporter MnhB subunit